MCVCVWVLVLVWVCIWIQKTIKSKSVTDSVWGEEQERFRDCFSPQFEKEEREKEGDLVECWGRDEI